MVAVSGISSLRMFQIPTSVPVGSFLPTKVPSRQPESHARLSKSPPRVPARGVSVLYKTLSAVVCGIDASVVEVEVEGSGSRYFRDQNQRRPFQTVGLP